MVLRTLIGTSNWFCRTELWSACLSLVSLAKYGYGTMVRLFL
jgi:hypothetical protein